MRASPLLALGLIGLIGLGACAGADKTAPATAVVVPQAGPQVGSLQALPPQAFAPGQCGLFLWSRGAAAVNILTASNAPPSARIALDGRVIDMPRTGSEGEPLFGHPPVQTFAAEGVSVSVTIAADPDRPMGDGAVIASAGIEVRGPSGWSTVVPAAGLIACRP